MTKVPKTFILIGGLLTVLLQGFASTHPLPGSPHFVFYLAPWHALAPDAVRVFTAAEPTWSVDTASVVRDADDGPERGRVRVLVASAHERAILEGGARANLAIVAATLVLWLAAEWLVPILERRLHTLDTKPQA